MADVCPKIVARFWAKVAKDWPTPPHCPELGPCWLWTASKRNKGYGAFAYTVNGHLVQDRAHRFSYVLHAGHIPDGLFVLHRCDVPRCCNPSHLFVGTNDENIRDMLSKGRHARGTDHHAAKMDEIKIRSLRADYATGNISLSRLARKYGLALGNTHRIVQRKAWKHVK